MKNLEVLGGHGLLLLAAFPRPLAIRTSGLGPSWSSGGKVEGWVRLKSFMVLNKDLCWLNFFWTKFENFAKIRNLVHIWCTWLAVTYFSWRSACSMKCSLYHPWYHLLECVLCAWLHYFGCITHCLLRGQTHSVASYWFDLGFALILHSSMLA